MAGFDTTLTRLLARVWFFYRFALILDVCDSCELSLSFFTGLSSFGFTVSVSLRVRPIETT